MNSKELIQKINNTPINTNSKLNELDNALSNTSNKAKDFSYNNSILSATNVQAAIDEAELKVIGTKPRLIAVRDRLSTIIG